MSQHPWIALSVFCTMIVSLAVTTRAADVQVHWLDQHAPAVRQGVSWGVPWPKGTVKKDQAFALKSSDGKEMPLQTWPLAYWPDGSLKWSGFATVGSQQTAGALTLSAGAAQAAGALKVRDGDTTISIDTGVMQCRIVKWGADLIESISIDGREVARQGRLVCVLQEGPGDDPAESPRRERFVSKVEKVTLEQSGPVRAVVRVEGKHKGATNDREWLPFVVRLYFYANADAVRMVHTIIYDGDEQKDFIRGLGVTFAVPMREQVQNRHIRLSGEGDGLWAEPVQPLVGRQGRFVGDPNGGADVFPKQVEGQRVPNREQVDAKSQSLMDDWAIWDGFKLTQASSDGFVLLKRTNAQSAWISAGAGKRASGLAFVGDVSGGLGVSLKNFWQSFPSELEIQHASTAAADLTVWMWSPDAPAMDMRHYDTRAHGLEAVYEDVQPGFSTPYGVARTSELMLYPTAAVPSKQQMTEMAQLGAQPAMLACAPEYIHSAGVFGIWSLPDRSTDFKKTIESELDSCFDYYKNAVDQWNWYSFWDFGDVMHSYDPVRHVWRYDLGGMAWDNSELGTDMWLWYMFLRSGRADVYRMAEAMTRHTSEVDTYHIGQFAPLGSRHNVRHWGCGAKEARISQALYRRFFYYLSTDERTGDLMHAAVNADFTAAKFDPMRLAQPITEAEKQYPGRIRFGPDWLAFVGNWMTEWERTGDTKWRDKIYAGMDSFLAMPYWIRSGKNLVFGYDPNTGKLYQVSDELGNYNLPTIMGGAQAMFELDGMIDRDDWRKAWLQYCRLGTAPPDLITKDKTTGNEGADAKYVGEVNTNSYGIGRLAAYAYVKTKNAAFAKRAVDHLSTIPLDATMDPTALSGPTLLEPLREAAGVSTNNTAQSCLSAIEILQMCADQLPAQMPQRAAK